VQHHSCFKNENDNYKILNGVFPITCRNDFGSQLSCESALKCFFHEENSAGSHQEKTVTGLPANGLPLIML